MYAKVELSYPLKDGLNCEVYRFIMMDNLEIHLDYYAKRSRETTRHKFKTVDYYDRLRRRESSLLFEKVPLSDVNFEDAKNEFIKKITFSKLNIK